MRRLTGGVAAICLLTQACAGVSKVGPMAAGSSDSNSGNSSGNSGNSSNNSSGNSNNSSANSGNSSNNSSANSGQSTGNTADSSGSSKNSSNQSNQSSQNSKGSSDSNQSSRDSSNNTTDDPDVQHSMQAVAGTALLVTTGVGVGLTIFLVLRSKTAPQPEKLEEQAKPAQAWLRANRRQLTQDLALGAGPALEDLAAAAEISTRNYPRFCRALSAQRAALLAPLRTDDDVSLAVAAQVMARIGEITFGDPVLRADAEGWLQRHPEAG